MRGYIDYSLANEAVFRPAELPDGRPAVEVPFVITVNGVTLKGAIDLVLKWPETGALTLRDLKTGNKLPNDALQLSVYGLAWWRLFQDVIEWGDFFMCKNNAPTPLTRLLDYSEAYIGAWLEMFDRSEKEGIYLPNGGDHCRVCTVRKYCPLMGSPESAGAYLMPNLKILNYNEMEESTLER
jgi:putative RecB family exonuclease